MQTYNLCLHIWLCNYLFMHIIVHILMKYSVQIIDFEDSVIKTGISVGITSEKKRNNY